MGFLDDYDALNLSGEVQASVAQKQIGLFGLWLTTKPDALFAELRAKRPVLMTPGPAVVTRYRDVVEVLGLDTIFSVAPFATVNVPPAEERSTVNVDRSNTAALTVKSASTAAVPLSVFVLLPLIVRLL